MKNEIWEDIKGYEGLYQVSNLGRVKSIRPLKATSDNPDRHKNVILKLSNPGRARYYAIPLSKNGISRTMRVHRMVAEAFIPNPHNLPCVNHKDENPLNNCVDNLEWCTQRYNVYYGSAKERCSKTWDIERRNVNGAVCAYSLDGDFVGRFDSVWDAVKTLKIGSACPRGARNRIRMCCIGKLSSACGYRWLYETDIKRVYGKNTDLAFRISLCDLMAAHH